MVVIATPNSGSGSTTLVTEQRSNNHPREQSLEPVLDSWQQVDVEKSVEPLPSERGYAAFHELIVVYEC
jgi:hypothetical protein